LVRGENIDDCPFEHKPDFFLITQKSIPSPRVNFDATRKRLLDSIVTTGSSVLNTSNYVEEIDTRTLKGPKLEPVSLLSPKYSNIAPMLSPMSMHHPPAHHEHTETWSSPTPITSLSRSRIESMIEDYTLLLERLEEWGDDKSEVYARRASLFSAMGRHESALHDARKCIEECPSYVAAYYRCGMAHISLKNYEAAIADFKHGLRYAPYNTLLRAAFDSTVERSRWRT
jgi:tetratricopeptide (TPR) repeat protein